MSNDIRPLIDFLERLGPEVAGRQQMEPQSEAAAKLELFARGECTEAERAEVCDLLRTHPAWIRWLADRVRQIRTAASGSHSLNAKLG